MRQFYLATLALLMDCVAAILPSILQPGFKAGSFPDLICELVLLPGKLIATMFYDRGTASTEFLWRSRMATVVIFSGLAYVGLRGGKTQNCRFMIQCARGSALELGYFGSKRFIAAANAKAPARTTSKDA
jgi:hypothetical protein